MSELLVDINLPVQNFLEMLDGLDVQILVTVPETGEILFANRKLNKDYSVDFDPVGLKCFDVYPGGGCRCTADCPTNGRVWTSGMSCDWERQNTETGKWYKINGSLIKWTDGREVRLQQGVDITEAKISALDLRNRLAQQELMRFISQSFISLEDNDSLTQNALRMVGEFLNLDRIVLVRFAKDMDRAYSDITWFKEARFEPEKETGPSIDIKVFLNLFDDEKSPCLVSNDSSHDIFFNFLSGYGISAFVIAPVFVLGQPWGAISMEMCQETRQWSENDVMLCKTLGNVISGVLSRQKLCRTMSEVEKRTHTMLNTTPMTCVFFDENYKIVDCNEEATRMFMAPGKQEFIDNFYSYSPEYQPSGGKSREETIAVLKKAFDSGREAFEWEHCRKDGTPLPVEVILIRVKWGRGYRLAGYMRDLREVKARMAEIEKKHQELLKARDRAEESAKAKSNFLANMSHEIRTPLHAIMGMAKLAGDSPDMDRVRYCLGKIDDSANHLLGVINDILDMSKVESGKLEFLPVDFFVGDMLQRVSSVNQHQAELKEQNLIFQVEPDVPDSIVADPKRLSQALTNLLSNAIKFTPEKGKIVLRISNIEDAPDECVLKFEVIDTGIGISKEQQDKLWESFQQGENNKSRRYGGTGLGLAITKYIIERMGGEVKLDSEPGKGSCFHFSLGVTKGVSTSETELASQLDTIKGVRVLLVDPTPETRKYAEGFLSKAGVFCKAAVDAQDALRMLKRDNPFPIILINWKLPDMDCLQFVRKVKRLHDNPIMVIMSPLTEMPGIEKDALAAGVDGFIAKPLLPAPVFDSLKSFFNGSGKAVSDNGEDDSEGIFTGKVALLAEDVDLNREIISDLLEDTGLTLDYAENGQEACELFMMSPGRYDIILMDIHMPGMDGYEATRSIRKIQEPTGQRVPIIAVTANVFPEDIERCLTAGMDDHVGKPARLDELLAKLKKYLFR